MLEDIDTNIALIRNLPKPSDTAVRLGEATHVHVVDSELNG